MADVSRINFTTAILVLAIWFVGAESKRFRNFAVRRIQKCNDQVNAKLPMGLYFKDTRKQITDELIFSGNVTFPIYFDDKLGGRLNFSSWSNMGGWKANAYVFTMKKICRSLSTVFGPSSVAFVKNIFGEVVTCPFYPGIYRYENHTLDLNSRQPAKEFIYGRWMVDAQFLLETGEVFSCVRAFADSVPA